jgi:hypothetical protein
VASSAKILPNLEVESGVDMSVVAILSMLPFPVMAFIPIAILVASIPPVSLYFWVRRGIVPRRVLRALQIGCGILSTLILVFLYLERVPGGSSLDTPWYERSGFPYANLYWPELLQRTGIVFALSCLACGVGFAYVCLCRYLRSR